MSVAVISRSLSNRSLIRQWRCYFSVFNFPISVFWGLGSFGASAREAIPVWRPRAGCYVSGVHVAARRVRNETVLDQSVDSGQKVRRWQSRRSASARRVRGSYCRIREALILVFYWQERQ